MLRKKVFLPFLFSLLLLIVFSCKKETEPSFPNIQISQPYENQIYTSGDTINITGKVNHDKPITKISLAVVDMNLTPITARFNLNPENNTEYNINTNIILNNVELQSGNYYLHTRASDGTKETNSYTKIYIFEAPLILEQVFLITKNAGGGIQISSLDTSLNITMLTTLNSDFGYVAADGVNKHLYISGKYSSKLYCYNYFSHTVLWQNMVQGYAPLPYFNDIKLYDKNIYSSIRQNTILGYNQGGELIYNLHTGTDKYPEKIHFHEQYLISSQKNVSGQTNFINVNFRESGSLYQFLQINFQVIEFFSKDNNNIFVFGNDMNNNAEMRIYDMDANGIWEPYNLPVSKIKSVDKIDNNNFLIAYDNKILRYSYNPNGAVTLINNVNTRKIRFDPVYQKIWIGTEDKKILVYDYPFAQLLIQTTVNDSIYDIIPVYNR